MGISPEDLHRLFEPFFTKKVMGKSGTGLGMAVVWGTVKDHKGYIDVESSHEKGTTIKKNKIDSLVLDMIIDAGIDGLETYKKS